MTKENKIIIALIATILILILGIAYLFVFKNGDTATSETVSEKVAKKTSEGKVDENLPYYFVTIHNEPHNIDNGENILKGDYQRLTGMVEKADEYGIKLTIMLSPQWADYIVENGYVGDVEKWMKNGHEIAAHHHSEYHGNWDGYSNDTYDEVKKYRENLKLKTGDYFGTMNDFMDSLKSINSEMNSGCLNDERNKEFLPKEIVYDTCSGFANSGELGTRSDDVKADKGLNEYIVAGTVNGVERKWLGHHMITTAELEESAEEAFGKLDSSVVYGTVIHSMEKENDFFYDYLEFLHEKDSKGLNSRTLSSVIEEKLIPEKKLSSDILLKEYGNGQGAYGTQTTTPPTKGDKPPLGGKCGDDVCDDLEKRNPNLCPGDCR